MLTTWQALYTWLRERVLETPGITFEEGRAIATVTDSGKGVRVTFADGTDRVVAAVIGADGYRSLVRRTIMPNAPCARYAGYLVWHGLVSVISLLNVISTTLRNGRASTATST